MAQTGPAAPEAAGSAMVGSSVRHGQAAIAV